ncbi:UNVERIFIED_CONTAM: hypothetical protein Scaly_0357100 [Sesamum calycinum]|uniref:S-adenosyl-L-methionine-dependent methyltransferase superfamily protein n=1 Tax=Sesamum calycinum TaxID=2727403 RepID=A0AAW2SD87_9LAMI
MGKHGKKQSLNHRRGKRSSYTLENSEEEGINEYPLSPPASSAQGVALSDSDQESQEKEEDEENQEQETGFDGTNAVDNGVPSKFALYQQSVQSPKGDISYLQKFFLMYVGGRAPLHLQEDFCGTALLSVEWLHSDARRTAVGLDLDVEALNWCMESNVNRIGADVCSRISLFHGNVLQPLESKLVNFSPDESMQNMTLRDNEGDSVTGMNSSPGSTKTERRYIRDGFIWGTSSEGMLRLQRRFPNFTYVWEQAEFDIIQRKTRISLHFNLHKQHRKLRHAFSYSWRLWSLPEVKDCLEEAGFRSVHFWIRSMPDSEQIRRMDGLSVGRDVKYEEATSFQQQDSWNAYIVVLFLNLVKYGLVDPEWTLVSKLRKVKGKYS